MQDSPPRTYRTRATTWLMAACAFCSALIISTPVLAGQEEDLQNVPWKIDADTLEYTKSPRAAEEPSRVVKASGNVILTPVSEERSHPAIVRADTIEYFIDQGRVVAEGNVELKTDADRISADRAEVFLGTRTGSFENATVFHGKNNIYISGQLIEKTGELTYHLKKGRITTCDTDSPDISPAWSFGTGDTTVTREGYAFIKNATFWIKKMPVLYSPIMIIPAKTERQSGLLLPEFSNSRREGRGMLAPLFLNFSPSSDATLYLGGLSKRGPQASAEFRYMSGLDSRGIFTATYLRDTHEDTLLDDFNSDGFLRTRENRFWIRGKADQYFANGVIGRLDIDLVSDRDYLQEFHEGMVGYSQNNSETLNSFQRGFQGMTEVFRENTAQLTRNWTNIGLYGELRGVDDTRNISAAETPLWSLPQISFSGLYPIFGLPADFSWQSEYIYYYRNRGLAGHRLDLTPRVTVPILPLGPLFEAAVSSSIRETVYQVEERGAVQWPRESSQSRTLFDITADLATTLHRDFTLGDESETRFLSHAIRPYGRYLFIPTSDQTNLPLFDQKDRVEAANRITYGISNFFRYYKQNESAYASREYAYVNIFQSYDDRTSRAENFSDINGELEFNPTEFLQFRYETAVNLYGEGVTYYDFRTSYITRRDDTLFANYKYKKDLEVHEITAGARIHLGDSLIARTNLTHSFNRSVGLVAGTVGLLYQPSCWGVELAATKTSEDARLMLIFSLTGLGKAVEIGQNL